MWKFRVVKKGNSRCLKKKFKMKKGKFKMVKKGKFKMVEKGKFKMEKGKIQDGIRGNSRR